MSNSLSILIPLDRVGVLLGHNGKVKKRIEKALKVNLKVESESGNIEIISTKETKDPSALISAREISRAIGRGFSPDKALTLLDEDKVLDIIDLREIFGKNENDIKRVKGRVIGRDGKIRRMLEEFTTTDVSVYGYTISIIGNYDTVFLSREAVNMLINGKQHSSVYKFLMRKRREMKKRETIELWEKEF